MTYYEIYKLNRIPTLNTKFINNKIIEIYKLIESSEFNLVYKNTNYSLNNYDDSKLLNIEQKEYLLNVWIALNL